MQKLTYIIEDSTIAQLLGVQNFTNDESAILEIVKNAYDAGAKHIRIDFLKDEIEVSDDGIGMNEIDIQQHWMHVGKSNKKYEFSFDDKKRVLAGSKGIGRFALARLGAEITILTKKNNCQGVMWSTNWQTSFIEDNDSMLNQGTKISIKKLRAIWSKKQIQNLIIFLSKTYNDDIMQISVSNSEQKELIKLYFPIPKLQDNCKAIINVEYNTKLGQLTTVVTTDEFDKSAEKYCKNIDLKYFKSDLVVMDEFKNSKEIDIFDKELNGVLEKLGDFKAEFYFNISSTQAEQEKFLYRYCNTFNNMPSGIILYRNAFSISSFEGKKDWLGLGKRSRKSPAAATHPTGAWRVRENQLSGKVEIDKNENVMLQDLSNRQGIEENIYYTIFIEILLLGIKEFERYRQNIIRMIDVKNNKPIDELKVTQVIDRVLANPHNVNRLSNDEAKQLASEIKSFKDENKETQREKKDTEARYKYDVRILNVLATTGLKASSIAHETRNDKNAISENTTYIIDALKEYDMWSELTAPDKTEYAYNNVPQLLESNKSISLKIIAFMDTILSDIQKNQFYSSVLNLQETLTKIKSVWERDYLWILINVNVQESLEFLLSEDTVKVIFDNLILNSIQQNDNKNRLNIIIEAYKLGDCIEFIYSDDGVGLDKKYIANPKKILEVHETTRKNGHGLGMWIVNNTIQMSGGEIKEIKGNTGFSITFTLGGKL